MNTSDNSSGSNSNSKSGASGTIDKPQGTVQQKTGIFPMDLASGKIGHVKTNTIDGMKVTPIGQSNATATFRAIGQPSQVRVVPTGSIMPPAMIKQIDGSSSGIRTQINAIASRTLSQTSITVTRPVTQTTYIPRTGTTSTTVQTQRLITPIRSQTPPTVTGSFVRGTTMPRNSSSPSTTVISPATTTWMSSGSQLQLIRPINQPPRQRIVAQGIASPGSSSNISNGQTVVQSQQQTGSQTTNQSGNSPGQPTYVATLATVVPQRQQTATLVYSNVTNAQQYAPTAGTTQRFAVATSLAGNQRRPIQLTKTFPAAKIGVGGINTTSISIRAPNIPVLASNMSTTNVTGTIQARGTSGNLNIGPPATRIIQLQPPASGAPQIIGPNARITNNLMPIIMNASSGGKIGIRPPTTIATKVQPSLTITQLGLGKLSASQQVSSANTNNTSSSNSSNVVLSGTIIHSQQGNTQPLAQMVNVSQGIGTNATAQIINTQNLSSTATVVPLAITSRANVLTGTITPLKSSVSPVAKVNDLAQQTASVFIHSRPQNVAITVPSSSSSTVISNSGGSTFHPGSTIFYESNSVTVSTGVLSLTTTTVTSSVSNNQTMTTSNLSSGIVTAIPFNSASPGTFTVVPSSNRTIGQIQIPVTASSSVSNQNVARYNQQQLCDQQNSTGNQQQQNHHQLIALSSQSQTVQPTHLLIAVPQSTIKIPAATTTVSSTSIVSSNYIRKHINDETCLSPVRVAKNLAPTLLKMSSPSQQQLTITTDNITDHNQCTISPQFRQESSDGSTTVSANSSPGLDIQIIEEMTPIGMTNESHFNPINEMYSNHKNKTSRDLHYHGNSSNGNHESPLRKKARRSTNDSQQSIQSHISFPQPNTAGFSADINSSEMSANQDTTDKTSAGSSSVHSNKENAKPINYVLRKPRTCSLLNTYKQTWKAANNHFQRYSDVKPRDVRRPTIIDLANQPNVTQKINGWKIYHLTAQMEDLCEFETQVYDKLSDMLDDLNTQEQNDDINRINELVKGNMQRSKIIVDGVNDAKTQILKIFDHKEHVADIINRCASKRNFKKRESKST